MILLINPLRRKAYFLLVNCDFTRQSMGKLCSLINGLTKKSHNVSSYPIEPQCPQCALLLPTLYDFTCTLGEKMKTMFVYIEVMSHLNSQDNCNIYRIKYLDAHMCNYNIWVCTYLWVRWLNVCKLIKANRKPSMVYTRVSGILA